ncbi:MAG: DUF3341 domain-containing protein [Desulfobacteraceae bacterium]|nr:DUF3341 domain-containing protein [Desulfobacteraceae bacterium]
MAENIPDLTYDQVNRQVLRPLGPPPLVHYPIMAGLGLMVGAWFSIWLYQVLTGMGVAGIHDPVDWGVYIGNYIFWVAIAMSGTMVSATLLLVRATFRRAVSRAAETMTLFAITIAGMYPLMHLGRLWVAYFILPYPSQRQIWPNFTSPLVWDMASIAVYLTVSIIFYFVGLLPDAAAARDQCAAVLGPDHPRTKVYRALALGWSGSGNQWRHHQRGYLFIAALITPVAISVHSIVAWDFGTSLLTGWHTTIYAPYFVAGAILSGMSMAITLLIPLRHFLHLEEIITIHHLESIAKIIIATGLIVGYTYAVEPFFAWYSGDKIEWQWTVWQATGWIAPTYWPLIILNFLLPATLFWRRLRRSPKALLPIVLLINVGMWMERYTIVAASTAHDFMPHNWGAYYPDWVEGCITVGTFAFFALGVLVLSKQVPMIALSDIKEQLAPEAVTEEPPERPSRRAPVPGRNEAGLSAVYATAEAMVAAIRRLRREGYERLETFTPFSVKQAEGLLNRRPTPVRYWTLAGVLLGLTGAFGLMVYAATRNELIVGGKPPVAPIAFVIFGFEAAVATGAVFNFIGMLIHGRLGSFRLPNGYDPRCSVDKFALFVACGRNERERVGEILRETEEAEAIHAVT